VDSDPHNAAAWTNWGRLLHERGRTDEADTVYRRALAQIGPDPLLLFNQGVLLEDLGNPRRRSRRIRRHWKRIPIWRTVTTTSPACTKRWANRSTPSATWSIPAPAEWRQPLMRSGRRA